ncbi:hypothetical protein SK91_01675, partial [Klebsiella michiganensis]
GISPGTFPEAALARLSGLPDRRRL